MFKKISIALVIFTLFLAGCSARATVSPSYDAMPQSPVEAPAVALPEAQRQASAEEFYVDKSAYSMDQSAASVDRMVIKNATLSISVDDPIKSMETISNMAESMGGFVVTANMYQQTLGNGVKVPQVSITIRVPAEKLDEALKTIKAETDQPIISEDQNSQDITGDYTDLNSRLTNLEAAEEQLQEIMGSATKTEDVLAVYSQLVSVREQIELIKGQMKYYEESVALSSISVQLIPNAAMQPITIAGWQPKGVAKEALQSLIHTLQSLGSFGIRLVIQYIPSLLIILGPIALIVWGIVSLVRRSRRARRAPTITPPA